MLAKPALALTTLLLLSSCAAILEGTRDDLVLETEPPGATFELSTGQTGSTPARLRMRARRRLEITFTKEGYQPRTLRLGRDIRGVTWANFGWLVFGLLGSGISFGIDFGLGSAWKFEPWDTIRLTPLEGAAQP